MRHLDPGRYDCVLISGASGGLGAALAEELARPGVMPILLVRDEAALEETARCCRDKGASCRIALCDMGEAATLQALAAALDREGIPPEAVICTAGILEGRPEGEVLESGDIAGDVLRVNLTGAITLAWLFLPRMIAELRGHVLFVSSLAALSPLADASAYSASKAGLLSYGLALRAALASSGVRIQVACPGYIASGMARRHIGARPGELSTAQAARAVVKGMRRGRGFFGFPLYAVPARPSFPACARTRADPRGGQACDFTSGGRTKVGKLISELAIEARQCVFDGEAYRTKGVEQVRVFHPFFNRGYEDRLARISREAAATVQRECLLHPVLNTVGIANEIFILHKKNLPLGLSSAELAQGLVFTEPALRGDMIAPQMERSRVAAGQHVERVAYAIDETDA